MDGAIHTLQEYMFHTESITYILIIGALLGFTFFYLFLSQRDDDEE
ncbi:MAG: hypothetical protein PVJ41_06880 [Desulfobacterales bacterium]|jgi:hypothetical protein